MESRKKTVKKKEPEEETVTEKETEDTISSVTRTKCKHQSDKRGFTERELSCNTCWEERAVHVRRCCGSPRGTRAIPAVAGAGKGLMLAGCLISSCERLAEDGGSGEGAATGRKSNGKPLDPSLGSRSTLYCLYLKGHIFLAGKGSRRPKLKLWWSQKE